MGEEREKEPHKLKKIEYKTLKMNGRGQNQEDSCKSFGYFMEDVLKNMVK